MTEQDKVTVDDIIGIVKTEEPTDSVALKKEAQLSICEKRLIELEKENEQLKKSIECQNEIIKEQCMKIDWASECGVKWEKEFKQWNGDVE